MKKIYISGCGGMLGSSAFKNLSKKYSLLCSDKKPNEEWLSYLDFSDYKKYSSEVEKFNPEILIHLGALTDLEYCEKNKTEAYINNILSVENAVIIAKKLDIPLVYISTAGVFDGSKEFYNDWDEPNPINVYGETKYQGEVIVKNNLNKYYILRAGWMMGGGVKKDKKFISKILFQIQNGQKNLNIVNDKFGTPTYTDDFINNLELLINTEFYGTYNMVCEGLTDRLNVTREIINLLKLNKEVKITTVSSDYFKNEFFASRPLSERLLNTKLNLRSLNKMRNWKICLNEYLEQYYD